MTLLGTMTVARLLGFAKILGLLPVLLLNFGDSMTVYDLLRISAFKIWKWR